MLRLSDLFGKMQQLMVNATLKPYNDDAADSSRYLRILRPTVPVIKLMGQTSRNSNPFLPRLLVTKVQVLDLSDRTGQIQHRYLLPLLIIHFLIVRSQKFAT